MSEFCSAQYLEIQIDRNSLNFVFAILLTRSRMRFLPVTFHKFAAELWPLIKVDWVVYAYQAL